MKKIITLLIILIFSIRAYSAFLLIPMDETQTDHLKAYGIAYLSLANGSSIQWLLNYEGGSFLMTYSKDLENECIVRGVSYKTIADAQASSILATIAQPEINMDAVKLEKAPKIAVYSPKSKQPWDDAVTLALSYAEIPYDVIYDDEIVEGKLGQYDWLHLHHEDFTGQYGKFWISYRSAPWYMANQKEAEATAYRLGFSKVSQLKLFVAKAIREFIFNGGFLFAMCSATDTIDIALAADGVDICQEMFDGDPADPNCNQKLNYSNCLAFENFKVSLDPTEYEFSDIDATFTRKLNRENDYFTLFEFSAKWDPVPTMLCQDHTSMISGFMGQTTAFNKSKIKSNVLIMGENKAAGEARYIHGELGKGTWTFYGGHDPEDYQHFVSDPPTDLALHPNSPGYRLILNNVLFPAAKKKKQKT
jgi:hypothetical protein